MYQVFIHIYLVLRKHVRVHKELSPILPHLLYCTNPWDGQYRQLTDEEAKSEEIAQITQGHLSKKWQKQVSHPALVTAPGTFNPIMMTSLLMGQRHKWGDSCSRWGKGPGRRVRGGLWEEQWRDQSAAAGRLIWWCCWGGGSGTPCWNPSLALLNSVALCLCSPCSIYPALHTGYLFVYLLPSHTHTPERFKVALHCLIFHNHINTTWSYLLPLILSLGTA